MELRKDYILDRYVIVSEARGKRPHEIKEIEVKEEPVACFFCPGDESMTPPEIARVSDEKGNWKIRVFQNKFATVVPQGVSEIRTDNRFFTFSDAFGKHEIIVETPDHSKHTADLSVDELKEVLQVYSDRITELSKINGIKHVNVFKNHGGEAGTSIVHSHTQIIANNFVPSTVREELDAIKKFQSCPYCDIINIEKGSYRRCFENELFVAFTPYASRFHYEIWIFPKHHINSITRMDNNMLWHMAEILKKVLVKLKEMNVPYNFFLHYHNDPAYHFHIEICPRQAIWAGYELGTDACINSVTPEEAAKFYRGE